MRPLTKQPPNTPNNTSRKYLPLKPDSTHPRQRISSHPEPQEQLQETQMDEEVTLKNETFYECTQSQEKIWTLFNSMECYSCRQMFNNKDRKPQIICANNHLLCKSCYSKQRQVSLSCPFCNIRMNTKNTSSHQSIQLFLKIYNEIFEKQKSQVEEKRKRVCLDFQMPKNIKTLTVLLLIIVTPWIYDALKFVVCWVVELEYKLVMFLIEQVAELASVIKVILQDEFFVGLYTNENGEYVYHGQDLMTKVFQGEEMAGNSSLVTTVHNIFTQRHKAKIEIYLKLIYGAGYIWTRVTRLFVVIYELLRLLTYSVHFIVLLAGLVQFPFLIPIILFRVEVFFPRKYRNRIGLYLDILEEENAEEYIEPQEIEKLKKWEFYFLLLVRNYIQAVLGLYKTIQVDMKKRCEELEYKKRMRLVKKGQQQMKETTTVGNAGKTVNKRFTF